MPYLTANERLKALKEKFKSPERSDFDAECSPKSTIIQKLINFETSFDDILDNIMDDDIASDEKFQGKLYSILKQIIDERSDNL